MADSIKITIEADDETAAGIASVVSNLGKLEKASEQATGKAGNGSGGSGGKGVAGLGGAVNSLNGLLGAVGLPTLGLTAAIGGVVAITKNAINTSAQYNEQVRDLSLVTGTGAEKTSRMLQVLDDFQLGAEDVTVATKAMTKQGLTPTLETLADLSDQYLRINDAQAQNEFILKNLGKGGLQWVNFLKQGKDAILGMNDGVNKNLILTDDQIKAYEQYRLRMDSVKDSIDGAKVAAGNFAFDAVDQIGGALDKQNALNQAFKDMGANPYAQSGKWGTSQLYKDMSLVYEQAKITGMEFKKDTPILDSATLSYIQMAKAIQQNNLQMEGASIDYASVLKGGLSLTKMNQGFSDSVAGITRQFGDQKFVRDLFSKDVDDLRGQLKSGQITNQEYYQSVAQLQQGLRDGSYAASKQTEALGQLETQIDNNSQAYALNLLQQNEALDPKKVYDFAVASGQMTKKAADQATAQNDLAKAYADGRISAESYAKAVETISGNVEALNGMTATAYVDLVVRTSGNPYGYGVMTVQNLHGPNGNGNEWHGAWGGGKLDGKTWTLVGDLPGGKLTSTTEAISPEGIVIDAKTTKWMYDNGLLGNSISRAGGGGLPMMGGKTQQRVFTKSRKSTTNNLISAISATDSAANPAATETTQALQANMQVTNEAAKQQTGLLSDIKNILANQSSKQDEANMQGYFRSVGING